MSANRPDPAALEAVIDEVRTALAATGRRPVIIGLCGAQGSGKSTLAEAVVAGCVTSRINAAVLSIDDLYLMRAERERLARAVHPLLLTRGVPGTHDIGLGLDLVAAMSRGQPVWLPRFDKARDDRCPVAEWTLVPGACEVLVLEGWCVGATPQGSAALTTPVNALERLEDADGIWRTYVNTALAGAYQTLFGRIDRLVMLVAPGFEVVQGWRMEQEQALADRIGAVGKVMDAAAVGRFVAHYERLTRHILLETPKRADLALYLDEHRQILSASRGNHM